MDQPWKTDKWFTSPWCYLPEVRKNDTFAPNIKIHDVTLRDGEQQTAVVFRREEKVAIAKQLDALGIHRIEAGMPAVSPQDKAAIADIAALGLKAEVFAFSRCIPEEIKVVKEVGCKGVVVEIPASDHMIKNAYGWSVDRAMKASIETTLAAKEAGPLHRVLHDRRHADRAEPVPRHRRSGRDRRPHGRAHDGRHDGRVHAGGGQPRGAGKSSRG